jgi:hypothetical protein
MRKEWLKVILGMYGIARKLGHLWSWLPIWEIVEVVVSARDRDNAEALAQAIAQAVDEAYPEYPGRVPQVEGDAIAVYLGGAGQIKVLGQPGYISITYGERLTLVIEGEEVQWVEGELPARPRDYARLLRVAHVAGWVPPYTYPIPHHLQAELRNERRAEFEQYAALPLDVIFASPERLAPTKSEEDEAIA